jgi:hypothetical protein
MKKIKVKTFLPHSAFVLQPVLVKSEKTPEYLIGLLRTASSLAN